MESELPVEYALRNPFGLVLEDSRRPSVKAVQTFAYHRLKQKDEWRGVKNLSWNRFVSERCKRGWRVVELVPGQSQEFKIVSEFD